MIPVFLSADQILAIHRRMIDEFGGMGGVRDPGLLHSAISMPAARFEGEYLHPTIPAMAAAYLFHICRNHPFMDGNKRTALAACEVFLIVNGMPLQSDDRRIEDMTTGAASGEISKDEITRFFQKHTSNSPDR